MSFFPTLEEISIPLPADELAILAKKVHNEGQYASVQTRFDYAWGLIKSDDASDQRNGLKLLIDLYKDSPDRRRECLYYLAIGSYKLGDFSNARKYTDTLLSYEPRNPQVNVLRQEIEDRLNREGFIGLMIMGSALAVGAAALGALLRRRR